MQISNTMLAIAVIDLTGSVSALKKVMENNNQETPQIVLRTYKSHPPPLRAGVELNVIIDTHYSLQQLLGVAATANGDSACMVVNDPNKVETVT
jgi:hypothetical protein